MLQISALIIIKFKLAFLTLLIFSLPAFAYITKTNFRFINKPTISEFNNIPKITKITLNSAPEIKLPKNWLTAEEISKSSQVPETLFDFEKIKAILPHRFPFLLIDKVVQFEPGKKAIAIKQITGNENQFVGHFPNRAIMPGVLQVEALAQLGGIVCLQEPISDGQGNFFFGGVEGVKWKRPLVPGDTLVLETELITWRPSFGFAKMTGRGFVEGHLALIVKELTFALVKNN